MSSAATSPARLFRIRLGGSIPIWVYIGAIALAGLSFWFGVIGSMGPPPAADIGVPWWALALGFYLTEAYVVHLHFRRESHTVSLNEIMLVIGFYVLSPGALVAAHLVGAGTALLVRRRQRPVKIAFNLAQFALTTSVAIVIFRIATSVGSPYGPIGWCAALLASVAACTIGIMLVTGAIAIAQGDLVIPQLPMTIAISIIATVSTTNLTLAGMELMRADARTFVLLAIPTVIVVGGFRSFVGQRRRHEHLEFLYQSMKATQGAPEFSLAVGQLLIAVRHLVRAEYAEIFLFPTGDEPGLRSSLGALGEMQSHTDVVTEIDQRILRHALENDVLIVPAQRPANAVADEYLEARHLPDAMITTLDGESGPFGLLIVGDRSGDIDSFSREDGKLLETFTGHASVLLENGRLERTLADVTELQEKLRHQAFHDALTGLPNRALFAERVVEAMTARGDKDGAAVLFLDLDDFKAINDSKGHATGDDLLVQVAGRVSAAIRPGDTPARLGGDEFAVLLPSTSKEGAELAAKRLVASFGKPFNLSGRATYIHTSVGVALAESAATADDLLRNADVAMYAAKAGGKKRFAHYDPAMYARVQRRHEFALDLEHAAERGEIEVMYQPIVSLHDGEVLAFEALARWNHPTRGAIAPAEFIPLAESCGLMEPIGEAVLRDACHAAKAWQDADSDFAGVGVSVNLSPGQLSGERFVDTVARTLLETRLSAESLWLEVTESAAMRDIEFVSSRLSELRALGPRLALDDFGTGHSSLERLDLLPLSLLKIAKPFVDRLLDTSSDTSFIDVFVQLAQSLNMDCVAEGIEHAHQVPRLIDRGCALGQGFYYSVPLDEASVCEYLASPKRIAVRV